MSWTAASRIAASAASRASRSITRAVSQTRTPSAPRKSVRTHDRQSAYSSRPDGQDGHPVRVVQVGEEAVADVVDLAGEQVDDRPGPLGRQRRLAEPVHLAVDLAAAATSPRRRPRRRSATAGTARSGRAPAAGPGPAASSVVSAPTLFRRSVGDPATASRRSTRAAGAVDRAVGSEVAGDDREQPGVVEEGLVAGRCPVALRRHPAGQVAEPAPSGNAPRPATRAAPSAGPTVVSSARSRSEWTTPRTVAVSHDPPAVAQELRARAYASACMLWVPWTRGAAGSTSRAVGRLATASAQARSRSSNRRNANRSAAPLYNMQ